MEYSKYWRYSANYFYLIGTILMVATLVLFFRKRTRNE
ncbi:LPXTG cell wall anchor domain-containing protein (plasmid) [Bacillus mycoides]|nr:LPXTG cell wall anchor domain-containing protein [Bacillus mycoides]QWG53808.1 LPXTG cell wall anchor domain-containing protein [Bacillus mycoides]QWG59318.1 LPXTG cell wall anchor domain-containing protein [Bacillus mycoides]QWG75903.1 LPXTG cell wall anchor domain-containing protein [Bacillus mycoides]QWH26284.1 LPXTG cell wall anchor domain-containing protein [Bacillus mycoides]